MKKKKTEIEFSTNHFESLTEKPEKSAYTMRLFVAGMTPKSIRAIKNVKVVCDEYLEGRYTLEVIDLYQSPKLAAGEQIIAVPTLIKKLPLPLRRIIGDLSDAERLIVGLDLLKKNKNQ